jgi:hypothetical protein
MSEQEQRTPDGRLAEAERLIAEMYRFTGTSPDIDLALWKKCREYCKRHNVPEVSEALL